MSAASDSPLVGSRMLSRVALPQSRRARWSTVVERVADDEARREIASAAAVTFLRRDQSVGSAPWAGPAGDLAALAPAVVAACRWPSSRVGMPNYLGWLPVPNRGLVHSVITESLHERYSYTDYVMTAESGPHGPVVEFASQPCLITWGFGSGVRSHFPDALALHEDGTRVLLDVSRSARLLDPTALAVFALTAETARCAGIEYEVRTEMPVQRVTNLRLFWSYRLETSLQRVAELSDGLHDHAWPATAWEAAERFGGRAAGLASVWRLVAHNKLFLDLNRPVTPTTMVDAFPGAVTRPEWVVAL